MANEVIFKDERVRKFLARLTERVGQVSKKRKEFVNVLSAVVYRDIIQHFEQERGPSGKWTPWSKAYSESMDRRGFGGNQILQFNGRLRNAFLPTNWRLASEGIVWFNPAKTGKGFPYALHHDEGKSSKKGARRFMWLSDKAMDDLSGVMLDHIMG